MPEGVHARRGFREGQNQITVAARGNYDASVRYPVNGLRVARELD